MSDEHGVQGFRGFRGSGVQGFRGFRGSGVQGFRRVQRFT
jgi:hypothetical protein